MAAVAIQIVAAFAEGERVGLAGAGAGDENCERLIFKRGVLDVYAGGGLEGAVVIGETPGITRRAERGERGINDVKLIGFVCSGFAQDGHGEGKTVGRALMTRKPNGRTSSA